MFSPFKNMELADHSATVQMSGLVNPLHSIVVCSAPMPSLARTMERNRRLSSSVIALRAASRDMPVLLAIVSSRQ